MRRTAVLTVLSSLVLAVGGLVATPAAPGSAAGTYTVSVRSSVGATVDAGQLFTLAGRVTGPGAAGKRLAVDLRVEDGRWGRVTTTTTAGNGTYRVRVRAPRAGRLAYRVVAPRSRTVGTGVSSPVEVVAYRWLDLYDEAYLTTGGTVGRGVSDAVTIGGRRPSVQTLAMGEGAGLTWNLGGRCTTVLGQVGIADADAGQTRTVVVSDAQDTTYAVTAGDEATAFVDQTAGVSTFRVTHPDDRYVYLDGPVARCALEKLPPALD